MKLTDEQFEAARKVFWSDDRSCTESLRAALESLLEPSTFRLAPGKCDWVRCPICGGPDMRREFEHDGQSSYILCTNLNCASNGGDDHTGLSEPQGAVLRPIGEMKGEEPKGCIRYFFYKDELGWVRCNLVGPNVTHAVDILLPTDDGRKEFEAIISSKRYSVEKDSHGNYLSSEVNLAWTAWQAARRAVV